MQHRIHKVDFFVFWKKWNMLKMNMCFKYWYLPSYSKIHLRAYVISKISHRKKKIPAFWFQFTLKTLSKSKKLFHWISTKCKRWQIGWRKGVREDLKTRANFIYYYMLTIQFRVVVYTGLYDNCVVTKCCRKCILFCKKFCQVCRKWWIIIIIKTNFWFHFIGKRWNIHAG